MKKFEIEVKEILSRVVSIEATCKEEALEKVIEMYKNEEIVLDYEDCKDTEYEVL